jgi:hypothetical protein
MTIRSTKAAGYPIPRRRTPTAKRFSPMGSYATSTLPPLKVQRRNISKPGLLPGKEKGAALCLSPMNFYGR